ncbi:hypothetical protein U8V72_23075 [Priestia filamentosa]|uniref:hypothetical protein n=1 Tax=Priestia filamentosa TaxID=1402861 RepID=UPI000589631C
MSKKQDNLDVWSMDTVIEDDSYELDTPSVNENNFFLETKVEEGDEDFFQEFNKPSQVEKKKTKQERIKEYKKINTKLPPLLHRMLKTYCGQHDLKKNDVFKEALARFMKKNTKETFKTKDVVNGQQIDIESKDKKPYNFEVGIDFFKEIKTYASSRDIKMIVLYEQAIIKYLNDKKFSF